MPVQLNQMREMLLPGLWEISGRYGAFEDQWGKVFMLPLAPEVTPVSLPVAIAMGAAAVVINNPVVSRRFWE